MKTTSNPIDDHFEFCFAMWWLGQNIFKTIRNTDTSSMAHITINKWLACEQNLLWITQGAKMEEWRMNNDMTLREAARKYKIDPSNLSKMERGLIKPDPQYLNLIFSKP